MVEDDKRELWKAEHHAYILLSTIDQLQDEIMPPKRYAETMRRLRKQAGFMARRITQLLGKETDMFERMDFEDEYYGRKQRQAGKDGGG